MSAAKIFFNRNALLVTKHGKEKVIVPLLSDAFGLKIELADKIDTDQFGTFSGEVERPDTQYNTARLKILKGFEQYPEIEIAIASEGAFNPHPDCAFIPVNTEIVMLIDKKNELEVSGRYLDLAAHVKESEISSVEEGENFAAAIGFPEYGVILKASPKEIEKPYVLKNFRTKEDLQTAMHFLLSISGNGKIQMQTDMRANFNPTRMKNIEHATNELVNAILSVCPKCHTPGFSVGQVIKGLPCSWCGAPTKSTLSHIYACKKCGHGVEKKFPHGKQNEDPGFCDYCNP
ncbi:MAG: hypothetical protein JST75_08995 [Bacteroidetes bacterium]|nr:hypothetical protein [Bacteroidota bacterium]